MNEVERLKALEHLPDERPFKCPFDIIRVGFNNIQVAACLQLWKQGKCTWEQMLMECVVLLADANAQLLARGTKEFYNVTLGEPYR